MPDHWMDKGWTLTIAVRYGRQPISFMLTKIEGVAITKYGCNMRTKLDLRNDVQQAIQGHSVMEAGHT